MKDSIVLILLLINSLSFSQESNGNDAPLISSNYREILVPRMTKSARDQISNPSNGLLIYQKDEEKGFYVFESEWKLLYSSSSYLEMSFELSKLISEIKVIQEQINSESKSSLYPKFDALNGDIEELMAANEALEAQVLGLAAAQAQIAQATALQLQEFQSQVAAIVELLQTVSNSNVELESLIDNLTSEINSIPNHLLSVSSDLSFILSSIK